MNRARGTGILRREDFPERGENYRGNHDEKDATTMDHGPAHSALRGGGYGFVDPPTREL